MRLLSRYPGLLFRNTTWRLFSRPKPAWTSGLNKTRLAQVQIRMAHIVPPEESLPRHEENFRILRGRALVSHFGGLFRTSPPDLAERLMSTITANPGLDCAMALCASILITESLDASIHSVVQILPRTENIIVEELTQADEELRYSFRDLVKMAMTYTIHKDLFIHALPDQPVDDPAYRALNAALVSASALKYGLVDSEYICVFAGYGLQLFPLEIFKDRKEEVAPIAAAGACLQLITAGSALMENCISQTHSLADIMAALVALRSGPSTGPEGRELLEKTIEVAKGNFANPLSASGAWKILFPKGGNK